MKKILSLFVCLGLIISFSGCFDDDDSSPPADSPGDNTDPLANYTSEDILYDGETIKGYPLLQFVSESTVNNHFGDPEWDEDSGNTGPVDCRKLFAYRVIASDNWNPYDDKGADDMSWDDFKSGYLLEKIYDAKVYFPSEEIFKMYDVKNAQDINTYRRIDILKDVDGSEGGPTAIIFQLSAFSTEELEYWNSKQLEVITGKGISIDQLFSEYVIAAADKGNYDYKFILADGFVGDGTGGKLLDNTCTWEELQQAYYIFEEDGEVKDKIIILGPEEGGHPTQAYKSLKVPESIEFIDIGSGDNPAQGTGGSAPDQVSSDTPDMHFTFPVQ